MAKKNEAFNAWKNLHADRPKPDQCYREIGKPYVPVDSVCVAASAIYMAYPANAGGGSFYYHKLGKPARGAFSAKAGEHAAKINDLHFSPFEENLLATGSIDTNIHLNVLGDYEAKDEACTVRAKFTNHDNQVLHVRWHPSAMSILASASSDSTVKLWNADQEEESISLASSKKPFCLKWSNDGSMLGWTTKQQDMYITDPRTKESGSIFHKKCFESSKTSQLFFADHINLVGAFCYNKQATRHLALWDIRKWEKVYYEEVDQQSSILFPHYDPDNFTLYATGRGEGSVLRYNLKGKEPYAYIRKAYGSSESQRGGCFIPKRACDVPLNECARYLKLMEKEMQPISFRVLRKLPGFQKSVFPDSFFGKPTCTAADYLGGQKDLAPLKSTMDPAKREENKIVKRKPYAELEKENEALKARIAELEAKLGQSDEA